MTEFEKELVLELLHEAQILRIQQVKVTDKRCDGAWERINSLVRILVGGRSTTLEVKNEQFFD